MAAFSDSRGESLISFTSLLTIKIKHNDTGLTKLKVEESNFDYTVSKESCILLNISKSKKKKHQALVKAKQKQREDDQCTLAVVDDFVVIVAVVVVTVIVVELLLKQLKEAFMRRVLVHSPGTHPVKSTLTVITATYFPLPVDKHGE